jgi:hypothetical protein
MEEAVYPQGRWEKGNGSSKGSQKRREFEGERRGAIFFFNLAVNSRSGIFLREIERGA